MTGSDEALDAARHTPTADSAPVNKPLIIGFLVIRKRKDVDFHA